MLGRAHLHLCGIDGLLNSLFSFSFGKFSGHSVLEPTEVNGTWPGGFVIKVCCRQIKGHCAVSWQVGQGSSTSRACGGDLPWRVVAVFVSGLPNSEKRRQAGGLLWEPALCAAAFSSNSFLQKCLLATGPTYGGPLGISQGPPAGNRGRCTEGRRRSEKT